MNPLRHRLRSLATALVLSVGLVATAASNGALLGPAVSAEEGPYSVVLTPDAPEAMYDVTALLDARDAIVAGTGEVGVAVELDPGALASLTFGLTSDVTGEANETEILDPAAQDQARVGIEAFAGCTGESPCEEPFVVHFARLDDPPEGDLEVTWYVDGVVEVAIAEDEVPQGSLTLTVAP